MVGICRYGLALLVLYSHLNFRSWYIFDVRINQGVYAVFCFYIVSGYFTGVIFERFAGDSLQLLRFYADRILRIMPAFLAVMTAVIVLGHFHFEPSLGASPEHYRSPSHWLQAALMPFNKIMAMFAGDVPYGHFFAVTPVASLAIEMQFFLLFPLIVLLPTRAMVAVIMVIALGVSTVAFRMPDLLEDYTYRNLSGVLPVFLCGYLLYRHRQDAKVSDAILWIGPLLGAAYMSVLLLAAPEKPQWLAEMALALITCPLMLALIMRFSSSSVDRLAGYVAYGVFLTHIPIIRVFHLRTSFVDLLIGVTLATAAAIAIHYLVERVILKIRHRASHSREALALQPNAPPELKSA